MTVREILSLYPLPLVKIIDEDDPEEWYDRSDREQLLKLQRSPHMNRCVALIEAEVVDSVNARLCLYL